MADWKEEANARIERVRKGDFELSITGADGKPLPLARIHIRQIRSAFHFGTAITAGIAPGSADWTEYEKFILGHFNTLVCENAMKWYATEKKQGVTSYEDADRLMAFAEKHRLAMRGHCLFWSKPKFIEPWVQSLSTMELQAAVETRLGDIVPRYRGRMIAWDVNNEMLDGSFFQDRLGPEARATLFKKASALDPATPLFVNEYGVLDNDAKLKKYAELIESLQKQGAPVGGIGIQEHAGERFIKAADDEKADLLQPERAHWAPLVPADVWRRLDELGKFNLPIHLTEISVKTPGQERRADALEALLRVGYAHPNVEAIMLWGFWEKAHWLGRDAALVSADWKLLPAGQRLHKILLEEWRTTTTATADTAGAAKFRGFFGTYEITAEDAGGVLRRATVTLPPGASRTEVRLR